MAVLKVRDPADPTGATWISLPSTGPTGPTGPAGGLPLSGGEMGSGAVISFSQETGDKVVLYPPTGSQFKIGVESGEMRFTIDQAANRAAFWVGGAESMRVTQDGIVAASGNGFFIGDTWHGMAWENNRLDLREYHNYWSFRRTNGTTPGTETAHINGTGIFHGGIEVFLSTQARVADEDIPESVGLDAISGDGGRWDARAVIAGLVRQDAAQREQIAELTELVTDLSARVAELEGTGP